MAQGALLNLGGFTVMECSLYPRVEVVFVLLSQGFLDLMIGVPVNACEQVLVVGSAGKSADALLFGFMEKSSFEFPPWLL